MSKKWRKSGLGVGESLRIPKNLFQDSEHAPGRLIGTYYIGEMSSGILIENEFRPALGSNDPKRYRMFISWAGIYAGHIKITKSNGDPLSARLMR